MNDHTWDFDKDFADEEVPPPEDEKKVTLAIKMTKSERTRIQKECKLRSPDSSVTATIKTLFRQAKLL